MPSLLPRVEFRLAPELNKDIVENLAKTYNMGVSEYMNYLILKEYRKRKYKITID